MPPIPNNTVDGSNGGGGGGGPSVIMNDNDSNNVTTTIQPNDNNNNNNNGPQTAAESNVSAQAPNNILLEGKLLKLSRNKVWQERHFVFSTNHKLSYSHQQETYMEPSASYKITKDSGCEISDLYVEQHRINTNNNNNYTKRGGENNKKESLYCISFTWTEPETINAANNNNNTNNMDWNDSTTIAYMDLGNMEPPLTPTTQQQQHHKKENSFRRFSSSFMESSSSIGGHSEKSASFLKATTKSKFRFKHNNNNNNHNNKGLHRRKSSMESYEEDNSSNVSLGSPTPSYFTTPTKPTVNQIITIPPDSILHNNNNNENNNNGNIPYMVDMKSHGHVRHQTPPIFPEYQTIAETTVEQQQQQQQMEWSPSRRAKLKRGTSTSTNNTNTNSPKRTEQEKLHDQFFDKKKEKKKSLKDKEKLYQYGKAAVATSVAVGVGVLTAGVGLAAGFAVLGAAAAAGGAIEVGTKKLSKKGGRLTIATTNYEEAKLWKACLEACLESESMKASTWAQNFFKEGRRTSLALLPHDVGGLRARHAEVMSALTSPKQETNGGTFVAQQQNLPFGQKNLFLHNQNLLAETGAKWRPLEGGWTTFLGPGAQSLRMFQEERIEIVKKSKKIFRLGIGGATTSAPLRAQVTLNAHPLDAFMCLMSYGRLDTRESKNGLTPNSGQIASFRLLEKIDDHTDIIHLFFRSLYLFPSWTEPRDFVLFRYWRYEPDGSYFVCCESVEHPLCPPQPGYVRGEMHQVCTLAPSKKMAGRRSSGLIEAECLMTTVVQVDPKGWIPTKPIPFLSNQSYTDAFGISALLQMLDIRDAIETDRFVDVAPELNIPAPPSSTTKKSSSSRTIATDDQVNYDLRFADRERFDQSIRPSNMICGLDCNPKSLNSVKWAEPDANTFVVRGPKYLRDGKKINAGASIGRLVAVDLVNVERPILSGMCTHPKERIQMALHEEYKLQNAGSPSDMPPFVFVVNICLPGPPFYHAVFYYAVDDMSTIDGSDGSGASLLCKEFLFGEDDKFRDKTFKLIPQIVEGNFIVRKAVGSTPAIMGTKLSQYYSRSDRFCEVILDCGSSQVATGVIRLSLGYAKTLMIDMGFLLEADEDHFLSERIFGCVRMKFPEFGPEYVRKVEDPSKLL